jgi:hypothetical protein
MTLQLSFIRCKNLTSKKFDLFASKTFTILFTIIFLVPLAGHANPSLQSFSKDIKIKSLNSENGKFGYRLEYHVNAPIHAFWNFKTDFDSDVLLSSKDVLEHRLIAFSNNGVVSETRYAAAPGLKFRWQTTVVEKDYRLEYKLLNPQDCRHDFHFGTIQLSPAGDFTKVTQTAHFDFTGAALWMKYPWYGGMKYTLTTLVKWEQKIALKHKRQHLASSNK